MDVDILDEDGEFRSGRRSRRTGDQKTVDRNGSRFLERKAKDIWKLTGRVLKTSGFTAILRCGRGRALFYSRQQDDTLKVAGKRVGPAEVESLLVGDERVAEAAVIGVPDEIKGTAMVAFVVLKSEATENLENELKAVVAKDMGKPLAPSRIHIVSALPKTRNAKVMRRVIRSAYLGEDAGDLSALENPKTVEEIRQIIK